MHGPIVGDESYFDSLRGTPATGAASTYVEGEFSGLAYDRGLANLQGTAFQNRPALFAAQQFAQRCAPRGSTSRTDARVHRCDTATAQPLSERALPAYRHADPADEHALGQLPGGDAAQGHRRPLRRRRLNRRRRGRGPLTAPQSFGIHPRLDDGSGLSRSDHTTPRDVVTVRSMAGNQDFVNSLSIAGETGTLQLGLHGTAAQGRCRGKTGTLHDVANEVGYCTARDGHTLAFAFLMNAVDPTAGHAIEDQMTVALAKYDGYRRRGPICPARLDCMDGRRRLPRPAGPLLPEQRSQAVLVEHRDAELLGLGELRPRALSGDYEVGLARHRARDLAAGGDDPLGRLLPGQGRQRPGQHERLSGQRPLAGRRSLLLERQALLLEIVDQLAHRGSASCSWIVVCHFRTDALSLLDLLGRRLRATRRSCGNAGRGCGR